MSILRMPRSRILLAIFAITMSFSLSMSSGSWATTLGVVADNGTGSVVVFDADANVVLGHIALPLGGVLGDCAVSADATRAFVTDFQSRIWVIDLTTSPPSLATGINPIPISNYGEDVAITPDQKFLLVSDGGAFQPISVVDIVGRVEIHAVQLPGATNSVDVSSDGSVLATTLDGYVNRLTIDGSGNLTPTGERLLVGLAMNAYPAPDGLSGVVILLDPPEVRSFTLPGLAPVATRSLSGGWGLCGVVTADRVFARSTSSYVDAFSFDAAGNLGASPLYSIPINDTPAFYGMDQMAVHPNGTRLYVPQQSAVNVYDAASGAFLAAITDSALLAPLYPASAVADQLPTAPPRRRSCRCCGPRTTGSRPSRSSASPIPTAIP